VASSRPSTRAAVALEALADQHDAREVAGRRGAVAPPAEDRRMTPEQLLTRLSKLLPSQFEQVLYRAEIPPEHLPGANAPLATRAVEVMRYVEQQNQLDELARIVQQVVTGGRQAGPDPR
jgi:hypothetical protein